MGEQLRFSRYSLGMAMLLTLTLMGWVGVFLAESRSLIAFFDNLYWTTGYACGALLAWHAYLQRARSSPVLRWSTIGLASLTLGQIVWALQVYFEWMPFPGPSDPFFLATGPLIAVGLWQLAASRLDIQAKRILVLDTVTLLVGVLTASMLLFIPRQGDFTLMELLVLAAYPLGLMLPACLALNLLLTVRARLDWRVLLLPLSLVLFTLHWVEWNLRFLANALLDGDWLNIGFSAVAILIGWAATLFSVETENDKRWDRRCESILRLLPMMMVVVSAGAVVIASTNTALPRFVNLVVSLGAAITVVLASIRQTYLLRERDRLLDAEEEIQRLAHFDVLTGLPNRTLLTHRLEQAMALSHRQANLDALILINIDRFKTLNDARGHALGNALLVAIGTRLAGSLREGDTLARLTADEFAILRQDLGASRDVASRNALVAAEHILDALRQPFRFGEDEISLTASVGISLCPEGENDYAQEVLRRADNALHLAKSAGGGRIVFFESRMGEYAEQRFRVERELHRAIAAGDLRLHLQSQIDPSGRIAGAEVLVRWQHPERGLLPPAEFIDIAEETDLIVEIGAWVMTESCRLMAQEAQAGHRLPLSVNLSPRQFRAPGFIQWVRQLLASTGVEPSQLTLEVTEGVVIGDIDEVVAKMSEIAALGVHFSLDDFGTGYSSLAYLKRLPIDEIKIDRTFVQDMLTDSDDAALVETIVSVARHMRLKVVAEGVETQQQADFLNQLGPLTHQGYLYGRPEAAATWIENWRCIADAPAFVQS
ncbi:EAL domain-containing protein [Thiobacillus sp.]|uniref:putative bifunctional diguanylate cyclase/phosphodiesterase n=1 Tax=Thiobacillus sp. TaxID=924 RepID=UPI0025F47156|nr:EAL domain-containing protein [Thiobacillus sp.]MBT9538838.1 EAL domain-containing protein [Thiobacillus sp.]